MSNPGTTEGADGKRTSRLRGAIKAIRRAIGPVAWFVLCIALALQAYISYLTDSLLYLPLALPLTGWHYIAYAAVAWRLRVKTPNWYAGPTIVGGLSLLAFDAFVCHRVLKGTGSTDAVLFVLAPFAEAFVVLPIALLGGFLLQAVTRAMATRQGSPAA